MGWPSQKNQFNQHLVDSILYNSLVQLVSKARNYFKTDEAKAKTLTAMEVYKPDNRRGWEKQVMFGESTDPEVWRSGYNAFLIDIHYVIHDCLSQELQWHRHIQKCGIEMRFFTTAKSLLDVIDRYQILCLLLIWYQSTSSHTGSVRTSNKANI